MAPGRLVGGNYGTISGIAHRLAKRSRFFLKYISMEHINVLVLVVYLKKRIQGMIPGRLVGAVSGMHRGGLKM